MEIRHRVRGKNSEHSENDKKEIDRLRQLIAIKFEQLDRLRKKAMSTDVDTDNLVQFIDSNLFDDLDGSDEDEDESLHNTSTTTSSGYTIDNLLPEKKPISIPSRWIADEDNGTRAAGTDTTQAVGSNSSQSAERNALPPHVNKINFGAELACLRSAELNLRIEQAETILTALRDLIAEKSFQYSHVLRVAPRKGVRTRARSTITQLDSRLGHLCRVYTQCRSSMVKLDADDGVLLKFRVLVRHDIGCSSALLNPNEPGSSQLKLSWIWQTAQSSERSSEGLRECTDLLFYQF